MHNSQLALPTQRRESSIVYHAQIYHARGSGYKLLQQQQAGISRVNVGTFSVYVPGILHEKLKNVRTYEGE